jgi:hypothetical protein
MEGVEEIDKETQRIYNPYNINFVAKLGKEIYYGDVFTPDHFNVNQLCGSLFIRAKRTINPETHELIWSQQETGLVAVISAKGISKL